MSLVGKFMQPLWRMTRGLTLGVQGIVQDVENRVLLVRHGYRAGWHLPGGGVEWNETLEQALHRELLEETGVAVTGPMRLHGVFANFVNFPGDHVAVFEVPDWTQPEIPKSNLEILEQCFFAYGEIPENTAEGAKRRLEEIYEGIEIRAEY